MDQLVLRSYPRRFWNVAEVLKNGVKVADINKYYEVTPEWIFIYGTIGGTGTGWSQGELVRKIFIGESEFSQETGT